MNNVNDYIDKMIDINSFETDYFIHEYFKDVYKPEDFMTIGTSMQGKDFRINLKVKGKSGDITLIIPSVDYEKVHIFVMDRDINKITFDDIDNYVNKIPLF